MAISEYIFKQIACLRSSLSTFCIQASLVWFFGTDDVAEYDSPEFLKTYVETNNLDLEDTYKFNNITRMKITFFDR